MALRIGGLASGMDTESIVKELMKAQSTKLDKFKQQKTKIEWKRDSYREFNTQFLDFRSKLTQMKLSTTFRSRTTTSSDDTRVSATATSAAGLGSFTINSVDKLATSAFRVGNEGKITSSSQKLSEIPSANLKNGTIKTQTITAGGSNKVALNESLPVVEEKDMQVKIGKTSYKVVTDGTKTLGDNEVLFKDGELTFKDSIAQGTSVSVSYITDQVNKNFTAIKDENNQYTIDTNANNLANVSLTLEIGIDKNIKATINQGSNQVISTEDNNKVIGTYDSTTGKISFNDEIKEEFTLSGSYTAESTDKYTVTELEVLKDREWVKQGFLFDSNTTIDKVVSTINSSNLGVTMFFDTQSKQMTMTRTETGESNFEFSTDTNDLLSGIFGFNSKITDTNGSNGQDAVFNLNGMDMVRSSNNFTINGVNFTLKKKFLATEGAVTVGINNDVDAVVKNIKDFVETYNTLISSINSKITERVNRNYAPPTDDEKEALSDKQLEEWLTQAKTGLLQNDTILSSALSSMRMNFYGAVTNSGVDSIYNQLTSIGISTTANYLDGGKLEINETKLRAALEADPAGVEALFTANGSTDSSKGILNRLTDTVNDVMNRLKDKAGNSFSTNENFALGRELNTVTKQIERWQEKLKTLESRYWKQFTAMEKAIQNANSQSASIAQFFAQ